MRIARPLLASLLVLSLPLTACGPDEATSASATGVRDTLADGTVRVRHALADALPEEASTSLRIGSIEGDPATAFGSVRGVEVGDDGSIWVLDGQGPELRVFEADGTFRRVAARSGGGPGELNQANGLLRDPEGIIWVNDHGHGRMIGFGPDGEEVSRLPRVTPNRWGYIWGAEVDDRGRIWQSVSHSVGERPTGPPADGLQTTTSRTFMKVLDPATEAVDSVLLGTAESRSWVISRDAGWSMFGIPFVSGHRTAVDPAGGFWTAWSGAYRIARLDEAGDTVLIVEGDVEPRPVTAADREAWTDRITQSGERPEMRGPAGDILAEAPEIHPVLEALQVDDEGRLWVRRTVPEGERPLYDVFDRDGTRLTSVRLAEDVLAMIPAVIRNGGLYGVIQDELDVAYVVRQELPEGFRDLSTAGSPRP